MPPKKKKTTQNNKPAWRTSKAKGLLRQDIIDKIVTEEMAAATVFAMRNEYQEFPFKNFKTNLKNLFKSIENEATKKPKVPKWRNSEAKEMLFEDICSGAVTAEMDAESVFTMRPEFQLYKLSHFKTNLKNLLEAVGKDHKRMVKDKKFFDHDMKRLKELRANEPPENYDNLWHRSPANKLLEADIKDGLHTRKKPSEIYRMEGREAYRDFPPDVFRKHVDQEVKKQHRFKLRFEKKKLFSLGQQLGLGI